MWPRLKGLSGAKVKARGLPHGVTTHQSDLPLPDERLLRLLVVTMAFIDCLLYTYIVLSTSRCAVSFRLCNKCIKKAFLSVFRRQSIPSLSETDLTTFTDDQG